MKILVQLGLLLALLLWSAPVSAFCGFYVAGADKELYNNATMVTMMRRGTTTVLSMRNNYEGPVEEFAMVVPVPVVLNKDNVKTLPHEIFDRIDKLTAPRLVEYWEQDPCPSTDLGRYGTIGHGSSTGIGYGTGSGRSALRGSVVVEAKFAVGEYDIVILSAKDATGLESWLQANGYRIPAGAATTLKPYVQSGSKFFVAKVNPKKVKFEGGMARLSPLRFHYPSDEFSLPIRLGLINSRGAQDLLVHILAPNQRYELANYANVTIPTNLIVSDEVRNDFGGFYAALFDASVKDNPKTVVTEYSWSAGSCDPCPVGALTMNELYTLGLDVSAKGGKGTAPGFPRIRAAAPKVSGNLDKNIIRRYLRRKYPQLRSCYQKALQSDAKLAGTVVLDFSIGPDGTAGKARVTGLKHKELTQCMRNALERTRFPKPRGGGVVTVRYPFHLFLDSRIDGGMAGWVLTRLHARYTADSLGEDLVFRTAGPIEGGRGAGNELSQSAKKSGSNNFQARYIIRHPWKGEIKCEKPQRGVWGGPTESNQTSEVKPALNLAFVERGKVNLASMLREPVPALAVTMPVDKGGASTKPAVETPAGNPAASETEAPIVENKPRSPAGCGCRLSSPAGAGSVLLVGLALLLSRRRRLDDKSLGDR